jgi:hypothetical protein
MIKRKEIKAFMSIVMLAAALTGCLDTWHPPEPEKPPVIDDTYTVSFHANGGAAPFPAPSLKKKAARRYTSPRWKDCQKRIIPSMAGMTLPLVME